MMRRLLIVLGCLTVAVFSVKGQIQTPDFAYPKTVIADAEKALAKAGDNGVRQLEALMQIYVANSLIDKGTAQKSMTRVLSYGNKQSDKELRSLFTLYSATIAYDIYSRNRWVYNSRELPVSPRPQDMTEWSGDMFMAYIDSLCSVAVRESGDMPISTLTAVIEADELSASLFPFVHDFVVAKAMQMTNNEDSRLALLRDIINYHNTDTPAHYAWMAYGGAYDSAYRNADRLLSIYNGAPDKRAAMVLWAAISDIIGPSNPILVTPEFAKSYKEAERLAQNTPFAAYFNNFSKKIQSPHATVNMQNYYPADTPFTFEVKELRNLEDVNVTFRGFKSQTALTEYTSRQVGVPFTTRSFNYHVGTKSVIDTTITATASLPRGYYSVSVSGVGETTSPGNSTTITVVDVLPVLMCGDKKASVGVYDACTGAPKADVTVALTNNKGKVVATQKSDARGLAVFSNPPKSTYVRVTTNGFSTEFPGERIRVNAPSSKPQLRATTTTQNGVYHPGDTIRFVTVAMYDSIVASGIRLTTTLYDRDDETVATTSGVTDAFGRIDGAFVLPDDIEETGQFVIATDCDKSTVGRAYVTVSDFKLGGIQLNDVRAVTNMPTDSTVTVSGKVTTYSGQPVGGTAVAITLFDDDEAVEAVNAVTDDTGMFSTAVPLDSLMNFDDAVRVTVAVTSPDGETVTSNVGFNPRYRYILMPDAVNRSVDISRPFKVFYKLTSQDNDSLSTSVTWTLSRYDKDYYARTEVLRGTANSSPIVIGDDKLTAGRYLLEVVPTDSLLADKQYMSLTLYNSVAGELPEPQFYIPSPVLTDSDGKAELYIGTDKDTYIYVIGNGADAPQQYALSTGFHTVNINIGASNLVYIYNVQDGVLKLNTLTVKRVNKPRVEVALESFRNVVASGSKQHWRVTVKENGRPVNAALLANVHDYRLDKLQRPASLNITPKTEQRLALGLSTPYCYSRYATFSAKPVFETTTPIAPPQWRYREQSPTVYIRGSHKMEYAAMAKMASNGSADMVEEMALEEAVTTGASDDNDGGDGKEPALRIPGVVNALWAPSLVADNGVSDITFAVPNANSTWTADVTVWTKELQMAAVSKTFVSQKPIMVSVNAPRFLRVGDKACIIATYMNTTDSVLTVTATLGCETDSVTRQVAIPAHGIQTISVTADIATLQTQCIVTARANGGGYGDGERHTIPVLPSQAVVSDSHNFYINPGDSLFTMALPRPTGQDFRLSLTYTENPMWTVVEALPSLFEDVNSNPTANAQAAALFSASVALGLMEAHPELEYNFDSKALSAIIRQATENLLKLQTGNGSIQWGGWSRGGDLYTTLSVLDYISTLKNTGYLRGNDKMDALVRAAVKYCDNAVRDTDLVYTIVRPTFGNIAQSLNGQQVMNRTVQWIIKNWRKFDIGVKAQAATAMHNTGNDNVARQILKSIDEFGTQTATKGYEFKNVSSLQTYAWLLEAYGGAGNSMAHLDGIRQYLIMRKQTTDWGNSAITSWIVNAMITSGTPWVSHAQGVKVRVDGKEISPPVNDRMGTVTTPIDGSELVMELSGKAPSYGAVVAQYVMPMEAVKAYSDGEISVEKRLLVLNRATGKWEAADSVRLGDNLKVLLTVKTDRPMSYVVVNDQRAAAFEPVVQLPRYVYADGVCAYLENRDAVTNLYLDYLPKGTYLFEYELRANNAGEYSSGIATATCAMAPTVTAHSSGTAVAISN